MSKNIGVREESGFSSPPPSREAVALLKWVNDSKSNEAEFWTKIWPRLIPTKLKEGEEDGFSDDGREVSELLDKISVEMAQ